MSLPWQGLRLTNIKKVTTTIKLIISNETSKSLKLNSNAVIKTK